jgi:hypothetical protein
MEDTSREIKEVQQRIWMSFTESDRIRKCAELFELAKRTIEARLPAGLSDEERKRRVFKEIYGFEFPEGTKNDE